MERFGQLAGVLLSDGALVVLHFRNMPSGDSRCGGQLLLGQPFPEPGPGKKCAREILLRYVQGFAPGDERGIDGGIDRTGDGTTIEPTTEATIDP